jgi:hypothetical protein
VSGLRLYGMPSGACHPTRARRRDGVETRCNWLGLKRLDLGEHSIWEVAEQLIDSYCYAVHPLMEGPSWSAAAVYVDAAGQTEKSTIWLSPKAVELMKPLPVFVDCDGPVPSEVELFLGAGDDFDPVTVELPDDLRPQVIYPGIIEHWIAHEIGEMQSTMSSEPIAEFALRA